MKTPTEEIIKDLRAHTMSAMREAADRLEELSKQLEKAKKDVQALARELAEFKGWYQPYRPEWVRKDPSRLEIAAMAMQGMLAASNFDTLRLSRSAFEFADALIAAEKEALK